MHNYGLTYKCLDKKKPKVKKKYFCECGRELPRHSLKKCVWCRDKEYYGEV